MILKFSEVLEIKNGKNQKKVENKNGKYPIYGSGGIIGWANEYLCEKENVIIGRKGSINKPIFVDTPFWNVDTAFGLIANREILDSKYLYYFCLSFDFEKLSTTVTIPSLTKNNLLNIKFNVPSLAKQRKIVKKLDKIQEIIKKYQQELIEFEKLSKSIFEEELGDLRTNEKNWKFIALQNICDVRDGTHDSPKYVAEGYPLITSKNILENKIDFFNVNYISKLDLEKINKRSKVDRGDILMPMIGTIGNPLIVDVEKEFAIKNVALLKFNKLKQDNIFIKEILSSNYFLSIIKEKNRGGTQKFLSLNDIRNISIPIVPEEVKAKIISTSNLVQKSKVEIGAVL